MTGPLDILQKVFGFPEFRGVQRQVVDRVLAGDRTLAVMPTGAGKSLCYQLPSVMTSGTCVVISPLIALMHDQLRAASAIGIRAAALTSVDANRDETIERFRRGELDYSKPRPNVLRATAFAGCCAKGMWRCLQLMRRTAFRNGGMTSGLITGCCVR